MRNVFKCAVPSVAKELAGAIFAAHKQVQVAVVVDIGPHGRLSVCSRFGQAARGGHIGECAIAIVLQQRLALGKLPRSTQDKNVEATIIVVVGLHEVQSAQLIAQSGLSRVVGKCAVAVIVEKMHGYTLAKVRGDDVKQAVAFKIVDDQST